MCRWVHRSHNFRRHDHTSMPDTSNLNPNSNSAASTKPDHDAHGEVVDAAIVARPNKLNDFTFI